MRFGVARLLVAGLLWPAIPLCAQPAVRGQVLDRLGSPLAGARVELTPIPTGYEQGLRRLEGREPVPAAVAGTDALGRFLLRAGEPGVFAVRVLAAGRVPLAFEPLPLVEETELPPAVPPEDAGAALVVWNAAGRPAVGVWVFAEGEEEAPLPGGWRIAPRIGRTQEDGSLTLPRLASEALRVRAFFGAGVEVAREAFREGDLRLGTAVFPERKLRVVDTRGQGVAGVLVRLGEAAWPAGLTDAEGRFAVRVRAEDRKRVRLASADGRRLATTLASPRSGERKEEEILILEDAPPQTGRVRQEEDGRPLARALIWPSADPGAFTLTDTEGRYRLPAPKGGSSFLEANAPGRPPKRVLLEPRRSGAGHAPSLALALAGEISGRVVDATGLPVSGAWVSALPAGRRGSASWEPALGVTTAADGGFRLGRLQPGESYSVQAAKAGFLPSSVEALAPAAVGRSAAIVLALAPSRAAFGRVLDEDGRPVAGAEVFFVAAHPQTEAGVSTVRGPRRKEPPDAVSDSRGRFTLPAIPALALDVQVSRRSHAPALIRNFKVPPGTRPVDLGVIRLWQGVAVTGVVIGAQGRPVSGAQVFRVEELRAPAEMAGRLRDEIPETTTGPEGRFSLSDQPRSQPIHLLVTAPGFLPATVRGVRPPTASPLRIRLETATRFAGRVLDPEGLPVVDANIVLQGQEHAPGREDLSIGPPVVKRTATDGEGRFEVAGIASGRGALSVSAAGFVTVEDLRVVLPQAQGEEKTVVLARGATLEGRAVTTAGDPVAGVRIAAGPASCLSDDEGVFRTDGVPIGPLGVEASHPHYPRFRSRLEIEEGVNHLEVTFETGTVVRGRVVDDAGRPVAGATAILQAEGRREDARSYRARTDAEGAFTFEPVAAGRYRLRASAHGYPDAELPRAVPVGGEAVEGLEVPLESGGAITGRILGLTDDELSRVAVRAEHEGGESRPAEVDSAGRYALRPLKAGGWLIQASLLEGQRHARARVLLARGGEEAQDLRFGSGLTLSGRVLYRDQALADALVSIRGQHLAVERSVTTDHDGAFRFDDLEADTYGLGLNQARELLAHNEVIELSADREVTIQLQRQVVAGRVTDAASKGPVAAATVTLRHLPGDDGPEFLIADASAASGAFRLERVPPGRYHLKVSRADYSPVEREVEVARGSDLLDLEVPLQPSSGAELIVRRASGGMPALLHLRLLSPSGSTVLAESRPVGRDGKVRLPSAPAGSWLLLAASAGGALSSVSLTVPGEPVTLLLPRAARLAVRVPSLATSDVIATVSMTGADGRTFQTLGLGGILEESWPLVAGNTTVEAVPAGRWAVSATAPGGRTWSTLVTTDGRTDVQVDME